MPAQLILDVLITVLLAITVGYCWLLNKRLLALRSGQDGLKEIIRTLNDATGKAQAGIEQLRRSSDSIGQELAIKIKNGRDLADELALIVESANNIANRLTAGAARAPEVKLKSGDFSNPLAGLVRLDSDEIAEAKHQPTGQAYELRQALRAVR